MPWTSLPPAPIARLDAGPNAPALRIFDGKPHALAFLVDGSLVVGASHGLTLHDPVAPTPPRAAVDLGGGVVWMVAHPDGESVVAAVRGPVDCPVVRVWPASGRVVALVRVPSFGYRFCGALSPDGARLVWRSDQPPVLHTVDALTGASLRALELPRDYHRGSTLAVRADGAVYLNGDRFTIVHPDGRLEPRDDRAFFHTYDPLFADDRGGFVSDSARCFSITDGVYDYPRDIVRRANGGTISHDRARLIFHGALDPVVVWDVAGERVIFTAQRTTASGSIPNWPGQSAAASATHVAAIDHADASITIWPIDQPTAPIAALTGYSQGAQRVAVHGGALTVHTCQPNNTLDSVLHIDLATGATQRLARAHVHDIARTRDGQRLLVLRGTDSLQPCAVDHIDASDTTVETVTVQRGAGELALAPDGATWGVVSHTYPASHGQDPIAHAQWRAFGAAKWAKNVKARGRWHNLALGDTAAAVAIAEDLSVIAFAKGKVVHTRKLPQPVKALAISRSGAWVAIACLRSTQLLRVATGAVVDLAIDLPGDEPHVRCLCFTDDDTTLFLGHGSGAITRHDVATGAQTAALHYHTDDVRALTWIDGALWSGSEDGTIVRWA